MADLSNLEIYVSNYKCIGVGECGFKRICPINIIIGRNNSGKSTLIDLIEHLTIATDISQRGHQGQRPRIIISDLLSESDLRKVFNDSTSGGRIGTNHWQYGKRWTGKRLTWQIVDNDATFVRLDPPFDIDNLRDEELKLGSFA